LRFIFITSNPLQAHAADKSGVEYIMIDLERDGKVERQKNMDTLISNHTFTDISKVKSKIKRAKALVRINPISLNSKQEIDKAIEHGADALMLPMFRSEMEVSEYIKLINNRVEAHLLLETSTAVARIDQILNITGIQKIHIGLNDLHIEFKLDFMFELFQGGIIEYLCERISKAGIEFGIGGIARSSSLSLVDPKLIMCEHARLGSSQVILSRDFNKIFQNSTEYWDSAFEKELHALRTYHEYYLKNNDAVISGKRELSYSIEKATEHLRSLKNNNI
jgi:2-keto-3-deoxy-L-rhamnonate aldolase RhmA